MILNEVLKGFKKSVNVKLDVKKTRNNRTGRCIYLVNFCKRHHQNLKYNLKQAYIFHLIFLDFALRKG